MLIPPVSRVCWQAVPLLASASPTLTYASRVTPDCAMDRKKGPAVRQSEVYYWKHLLFLSIAIFAISKELRREICVISIWNAKTYNVEKEPAIKKKGNWCSVSLIFQLQSMLQMCRRCTHLRKAVTSASSVTTTGTALVACPPHKTQTCNKAMQSTSKAVCPTNPLCLIAPLSS